jgi:hypothetical protein
LSWLPFQLHHIVGCDAVIAKPDERLDRQRLVADGLM